jgi:hypothetical protein
MNKSRRGVDVEHYAAQSGRERIDASQSIMQRLDANMNGQYRF